MPEPKASPVSAIGPVTKVVTLPDPGPGGPIRIEIRKVHPAELLTHVGNMPTMAAGEQDGGLAATLRVIDSTRAPIAAVAAAVIVSPPFSFGESREDGKAWWGDLSWPNQLAIFNEGMAFAGLVVSVKEGSDEDVARRVARFHGDKKGPKVRRRAGGPRKAAR
jgi:hypothetical protein